MRDKILFVAILLFVLSATLVSALDAGTNKIIGLTTDSVGILIGITLVIFIITILKSFTGSLKKTFYYIMYGISFQILALIYTIVFLRLGLYPIPLDIEVHHLFMVIGIVFFGIATYNLNKMMAELKKK